MQQGVRMAADPGLLELLRDELAGQPGLTEKRMFGGICFLIDGNMLCGVLATGAIFRVGKEAEPAALRIEGVRPMSLTGRRMGGMIEVDAEALADDDRRGALCDFALRFVRGLPAK